MDLVWWLDVSISVTSGRLNKTHNIRAGWVTGETVAAACLANGEGRNGGTELRAAGADWCLALDNLSLRRCGESWASSHEQAKDGGDGWELHFDGFECRLASFWLRLLWVVVIMIEDRCLREERILYLYSQ